MWVSSVSVLAGVSHLENWPSSDSSTTLSKIPNKHFKKKKKKKQPSQNLQKKEKENQTDYREITKSENRSHHRWVPILPLLSDKI